MKKLIVSGILLISSCLSFGALAASPYGDCPTSDSNTKFCNCFYQNCDNVFGSGQCQYSRLMSYFNTVGASRACSAYGHGEDQQKCIDGITHFMKVCG